MEPHPTSLLVALSETMQVASLFKGKLKRAVRIAISVVAAGLITSWLVALALDVAMLRDVAADWKSLADLLPGALALVFLASLYGLGVGMASLVVLFIPLLVLTTWAERHDFTSRAKVTGAAAALGFLLGACVLNLPASAPDGAAWVMVLVFAVGGAIAGGLYFRQRRRFG